MKVARALLVLLLCAASIGALVAAMLALPPPALHLPAQVKQQLDASGVSHPVTAVLLNFRAYDTLLEVAVLLLALLGVLAGTGVDGRRRLAVTRSGLPMLKSLARVLAPLMVLVAIYLLWAGSSRPGGAFQAGAVLAAAGVLLHLARLLPAWTTPRLMLRLGLTIGLFVFLLLAAWPTIADQGAMLSFPPAWAGVLILLIETGLTLSLGLLLAGLFLCLSDDGMEGEA